MKKLALQLLVPAFSIALLAGCVEPPVKSNPNPEFCEGTSCETLDKPELTGVFVSGHLGNYSDCPEDGWTEPTAAGDPDGAAPQGDVAEGACAPDTECTPIVNCEFAQATINVRNIGDVVATGIQVDRIELFNDDGDLVATLPVMDVTETGAAFDGELADGDEATLRIDFQGPQNPYQLLQTTDENGDARFAASGSGTLRIVVSADDHDEIKVEGKEIYAVPSVDT